MNFIRGICNALINLFMRRSEIPRLIVDETKKIPEIYESIQTGDPSDEIEIPELPKEFIPEPFYSTMLSEDLVESPLYVPSQLPMTPGLLEPPQLDDTAMGISIPRSDEDTVL